MHIDDLDIGQIRLLAELLDTGSLSLAARRIGLSQSAASHALAKLRVGMGDALFVRAAGGVQPTPYGERLGAAARQALDALLEGLAANRPFDPETSTRRFNVYMSDVGQMVLLPRLLAFMKQEAPRASLRAWPIPLDNPGGPLASGEVDLAVGFFSNLTTGFRQALLFRERYVCAVRADHPRFRAGMSLDGFVATPHAIADSSGMAHAVIERILARHRIKRAVTLTVPEYLVLPMIVASSDLAVVMPARLAEAFSAYVKIKVLPAPVALPAYDIRAYWHERYHQDATISWIRNAVIRLFRDRGGGVG
jgi:DNA-binding transcriptional LysR family regulator